MSMVNKTIRQVQIDLITDTPNEIVEWFSDLWSKLYIIETDVYHNDGGELIYYMIDHGKKQWVFYQYNKNDIFWGHYKNYWSLIKNRFDLGYSDIQGVSKLLVENALSNSVATPHVIHLNKYEQVENSLNISVATPFNSKIMDNYLVECALNNSVSIPNDSNILSDELLDIILNKNGI